MLLSLQCSFFVRFRHLRHANSENTLNAKEDTFTDFVMHDQQKSPTEVKYVLSPIGRWVTLMTRIASNQIRCSILIKDKKYLVRSMPKIHVRNVRVRVCVWVIL